MLPLRPVEPLDEPACSRRSPHFTRDTVCLAHWRASFLKIDPCPMPLCPGHEHGGGHCLFIEMNRSQARSLAPTSGGDTGIKALSTGIALLGLFHVTSHDVFNAQGSLLILFTVIRQVQPLLGFLSNHESHRPRISTCNPHLSPGSAPLCPAFLKMCQTPRVPRGAEHPLPPPFPHLLSQPVRRGLETFPQGLEGLRIQSRKNDLEHQ